MYCPTCQVTITASQHQCVERKKCATCGEEKAIQEFPIHPSSFDGHRHNCALCVDKEKTRQKEQRRNYRMLAAQQRLERQAKREKENLLLHAYGYRWKKETIAVDYGDGWEPEEGWVLYTPAGAQINLSDALQEIARLQEHKPGHPSALWAYDLLSLSHPLVLILDTETTGFNEDAEVIEIALLDKYGQVYLNTLVQCQQEAIPQEAMRVHRIHKSMLRNAPTFPQVWQKLQPLLASHEVVIYNAEYDLRLLKQTAQRYRLDLPEMHKHCLMQHYSAYVGQASARSEGYRSMRLAAACFHFQIEQTDTHRALPDAQVSLEVLRRLAAQSVQEA